MNRLKLMKFYLCGNMDGDREGGKAWRDDMTDWLFDRAALPLNPYNKPILEGASGVEDDANYEAVNRAKAVRDFATCRRLMRPVVFIDLRMVDEASALIINLDLEKSPCGTWDETFCSQLQKKPCIIHCVQGCKSLPNWMFGRMPYQTFFDTWDEVKEYLNEIDTADEVDDLGGRWKFFDYEPLVRRALGLVSFT